jgi:hypothetical protein
VIPARAAMVRLFLIVRLLMRSPAATHPAGRESCQEPPYLGWWIQ